MTSFYLTLPSNASRIDYPNNKQSSFTINLENELNLVDFEVALCEINYSPFFSTNLGFIEIENLFQNKYKLIHGDNFKIPVSILNSISAKDLCEKLNNLIKQHYLLKDILYLNKLLTKKIDSETLELAFNINKTNNENNIFELELYRSNEINSKYVFIDKEESIYKTKFLQLIPILNYNKNLMRYEFTAEQVLILANKFKIILFIYKVTLGIKIDEFNFKNNLGAFILNDELENEQFLASLFIEKELKLEASNLDFIRETKKLSRTLIIFKNEQNNIISQYKIIDLPKLSFIHNDEDSLRSLIQIHFENKLKVKFNGTLANIFGFMEKIQTLNENSYFLIDSTIKTINYALIYTDFIEQQYFGESKKPILKIIPIKSSSDTEVVTFFDSLHYVRVSKTSINSITINIKDLFDQTIKFENNFAFIILKLHFRKIRNE